MPRLHPNYLANNTERIVSGGKSTWEPAIKACPYCDEPCEADWVDVGVGLVQCGPYYCQNCKASEIGPYDPPREGLPPEAEQCGWYQPYSPVSPLANTRNGVPVNHVLAKALYRDGLLDAPRAVPVCAPSAAEDF